MVHGTILSYGHCGEDVWDRTRLSNWHMQIAPVLLLAKGFQGNCATCIFLQGCSPQPAGTGLEDMLEMLFAWKAGVKASQCTLK